MLCVGGKQASTTESICIYRCWLFIIICYTWSVHHHMKRVWNNPCFCSVSNNWRVTKCSMEHPMFLFCLIVEYHLYDSCYIWVSQNMISVTYNTSWNIISVICTKTRKGCNKINQKNTNILVSRNMISVTCNTILVS